MRRLDLQRLRYQRIPSHLMLRSFQFGALMNSTQPGLGRLASKRVSSKLAPYDFWMLAIYPNGHNEQNKGRVSVFLQPIGPMVV